MKEQDRKFPVTSQKPTKRKSDHLNSNLTANNYELTHQMVIMTDRLEQLVQRIQYQDEKRVQIEKFITNMVSSLPVDFQSHTNQINQLTDVMHQHQNTLAELIGQIQQIGSQPPPPPPRFDPQGVNIMKKAVQEGLPIKIIGGLQKLQLLSSNQSNNRIDQLINIQNIVQPPVIEVKVSPNSPIINFAPNVETPIVNLHLPQQPEPSIIVHHHSSPIIKLDTINLEPVIKLDGIKLEPLIKLDSINLEPVLYTTVNVNLEKIESCLHLLTQTLCKRLIEPLSKTPKKQLKHHQNIWEYIQAPLKRSTCQSFCEAYTQSIKMKTSYSQTTSINSANGKRPIIICKHKFKNYFQAPTPPNVLIKHSVVVQTPRPRIFIAPTIIQQSKQQFIAKQSILQVVEQTLNNKLKKNSKRKYISKTATIQTQTQTIIDKHQPSKGLWKSQQKLSQQLKKSKITTNVSKKKKYIPKTTVIQAQTQPISFMSTQQCQKIISIFKEMHCEDFAIGMLYDRDLGQTEQEQIWSQEDEIIEQQPNQLDYQTRQAQPITDALYRA